LLSIIVGQVAALISADVPSVEVVSQSKAERSTRRLPPSSVPFIADTDGLDQHGTVRWCELGVTFSSFSLPGADASSTLEYSSLFAVCVFLWH